VLDFGIYIASPGYRGHLQLLEGVQRRSTKAVFKMREEPYDERFKKLKSSILVYRRRRADIIMTYKLTSQKTLLPPINLSISRNIGTDRRGHSKKLFKLL
jgi:hypothetical protein